MRSPFSKIQAQRDRLLKINIESNKKAIALPKVIRKLFIPLSLGRDRLIYRVKKKSDREG
jgi:hypothetical protein